MKTKSTAARENRGMRRKFALACFGLLLSPAISLGATVNKARQNNFLKNSADSARRSVVKYCDYAFIECEVDPKNPSSFRTLGGTFGMGVFASLLNMRVSDVDIYANLGLNGPGLIQLDATHLITPDKEARIPVFIKVAQDETASQAEKRSMNQRIGYFEKEMLRARTFGRKGFGPEYYDVIMRANGSSHPLHKNAYIMRQLQGKTGSELVKDFNIALQYSLDMTLTRMVGSFEQELNQRKTQFPQTREMAKLVLTEAWQWTLPSLDMLRAILLFLERMWNKNLHHCDFHLSNVMFIHDIVQDPQEVVRRIRNSEAFTSAAAGSFMIETSNVSKNIPTPMPMYRFAESRIQAIDLAYAINLAAGRRSSAYTANPCLVYRAERSEDTYEFHRSLVYAQGMLARCYDIWTNARKQMKGKYELFQKMEEQLPDTMSSLDRAFSSMRQYFQTLSSRMLQEAPSWDECLKNKDEYVGWLKRQRSNSPKVRLKFPKEAQHKCTVYSEKNGLQKVLHMLYNETSYLCQNVFPRTPEFAQTLCAKLGRRAPPATDSPPPLAHQLPNAIRHRAAVSPLGVYSD